MKRIMLVLLCTIFSLPVFAQSIIIVKTEETKVFKDRCVSVEEASKYVSTETLEAIKEGRIPDVCLNPRKGLAMMQNRKKNEDILARKSGCVTRDEARIFAIEDGQRSEWYRWDEASGGFNEQRQEWSFFVQGQSDSFGDHFGIVLSCRGEVLRVYQGR